MARYQVQTAALLLAVGLAASAQAQTPGTLIVGNSQSKVYHMPSKNQVIFATEAAAIAAGYRKAGVRKGSVSPGRPNRAATAKAPARTRAKAVPAPADGPNDQPVEQ